MSTPSQSTTDSTRNEVPLDASLVSIEGFEAYLKENLETEYKGRDIADCPIARYLQHVYNAPDLRAALYRAYHQEVKDNWAVERHVLYYRDEHDWISSFIVKFDSTWDKRSPLNGSDALEVLEKLKAQRSNSLKETSEQTTGQETTETLQG